MFLCLKPVKCYHSRMIVLFLLLEGIQLVAVGVIGGCLGRIFIETKQRPSYFWFFRKIYE